MDIREMEMPDAERPDFWDTLSHLGEAEMPSRGLLHTIFAWRCVGYHRTLVAEEGGRIIGTATLVLSWKFLHGGRKAGRISDVATHADHVGRGVGTALVERLLEIAREEGCYKVTLNCSRLNAPWYQRFGFREAEVAMRINL